MCPAGWRRIIGKMSHGGSGREADRTHWKWGWKVAEGGYNEKAVLYLWIILLDPSDSSDLRKTCQGHRIMP